MWWCVRIARRSRKASSKIWRELERRDLISRSMIDLHSHTDESDGTFTPAELVAEAVRIGLSGAGDYGSRYIRGL